MANEKPTVPAGNLVRAAVAGQALAAAPAPMAGPSPFEELPFPSPGDRIRADDFKKLSLGLRIIYDAYLLSSALFGRNFSEAKLVLAAQQYQVSRVMSVFGTEISDPADTSLDNRKVIQVAPVALGERRVTVVLTEAVDTRRFAPNLLGLTYRDASERLRALLGDVSLPGTPPSAWQLVGLSLADAKQLISK